jgi:hypothetical protein
MSGPDRPARVHQYPPVPAPDYQADPDWRPMSADEFELLASELEAAVARTSAHQLITLHSIVGTERDERNQRERLLGPAGVAHGQRWEPWAELRRRAHLEFRWVDQIRLRADSPARYDDPDDPDDCRGLIVEHPVARRTIYLTRDGEPWRQHTLTHELTHDDRGVFDLGTPRDLVEAEEEIVRRITADRMDSRWDGRPGPSVDVVRGRTGAQR